MNGQIIIFEEISKFANFTNIDSRNLEHFKRKEKKKETIHK